MKVIITDDEILVAQNLEMLLKRYCPDIIVEGIAHSAKDAEALIRDKRPDIVFLDVEMPNGNGFDLLKRFDQINFGVIFVTAFDHYAIKAIKYSAIDYLLKPIDINELVAAVEKADQQIKNKSVNQGLNLLLNNLAQPSARLQKLTLPTMDGMIFVNIDEILYCKSDGNYTSFYLANGQTPMATRQIGTYEDLLPEPLFCRIHRQYIVNVNKVSKYIKGRGGYVVMSDGKVIDVSVRKKEDFLNAYKVM
jgi:two-component system LytT family response regulator